MRAPAEATKESDAAGDASAGRIHRRTFLGAIAAMSCFVAVPVVAHAATVGTVRHGADPALTRPTADTVLWIGTVRPHAARDGDEWLVA